MKKMLMSAGLAAASMIGASMALVPPATHAPGAPNSRRNGHGRRVDHETFDWGRYREPGAPRPGWTYRGARFNALRRHPVNGKVHARIGAGGR